MSRSFLFTYLILLTIFIVGCVLLYNNFSKSIFIDATAPFGFFAVLSPFTHYFATKAIQAKSNTSFITFFYTGFALKFFLSILFVVLYLVLAQTFSAKHFAISFIIGYLSFTIMETVYLLKGKQP